MPACVHVCTSGDGVQIGAVRSCCRNSAELLCRAGQCVSRRRCTRGEFDLGDELDMDIVP